LTFTIDGDMLIGQACRKAEGRTWHAMNPATGAHLEPAYANSELSDVDQACRLAAAAFDAYRAVAELERAAFLERIAANILELGPALIDRAVLETGLPAGRLEGERARTVGQLRLFAQVLRDGRFIGATLDQALPERSPRRPDLRLRRIGLGPVAVFGASNFPLAFSAPGGDTASALAAGCPVIVKAHPAHPGTSELVGKAVQAAVAACGLHEGVFSLVYGDGHEVGAALVSHAAVKAVGFTGSRSGGLALMRLAAARAEPIPVYAEMSSINPLFLLPGALDAGAEAIGAAFADSLTLGAGQFCTNPGLVLAIKGAAADRFIEAASSALQEKTASTMLSAGIHAAYERGVEKLERAENVRVVARGKQGEGACAGRAALFVTDATCFLANRALEEENFGASSLVVLCADVAQMHAVAEHLEGQLTVTLFLDENDRDAATMLLSTLERKAGRLLVNGFPTGVEVAHAMVHGGPFPATSDSRSTSVGAGAIERFLRPVCYQDFPAWLLPPSLQDGNPLGIPRLRDGGQGRD
jgi:NADP-dependent aldehyde dehydrogenase